MTKEIIKPKETATSIKDRNKLLENKVKNLTTTITGLRADLKREEVKHTAKLREAAILTDSIILCASNIVKRKGQKALSLLEQAIEKFQHSQRIEMVSRLNHSTGILDDEYIKESIDTMNSVTEESNKHIKIIFRRFILRPIIGRAVKLYRDGGNVEFGIITGVKNIPSKISTTRIDVYETLILKPTDEVFNVFDCQYALDYGDRSILQR